MLKKIFIGSILISSFINANEIKIKNDVGGDLYEFSRKDLKDSLLSEKDINLRDYYYKIKNREGCFFNKDTIVEVLLPLTDGKYLIKDISNNCTDYISVNELYKVEEIKEDIKKIEEIKVVEEIKPIIIEPIKKTINYNVYVIATYLKETQANKFIKNKLENVKTNITNNKGIYTLEVYLKDGSKESQLNYVKNLSKDSYFKNTISLEELKK